MADLFAQLLPYGVAWALGCSFQTVNSLGNLKQKLLPLSIRMNSRPGIISTDAAVHCTAFPRQGPAIALIVQLTEIQLNHRVI